MKRLLITLVVSILVIGCLWAQVPQVEQRDNSARLTDGQREALRELPQIRSLNLDDNGIPTFVTGRLGYLRSANMAGGREYLQDIGAALRATGNEGFTPLRSLSDRLGQVHLRYQQTLYGLPVVGADMIVHIDKTSGEVLAFNGNFLPNEANLPIVPRTDPGAAMELTAIQAGIDGGTWLDDPELTYVVEAGKGYLAWVARIQYANEQGPQIDRLFADAITGDLVAQHGLIHYALNRKIYNGNHTNPDAPTLPGTLMFSEGGSSTDAAAMDCYTNFGYTYNYYKSKFNRDSIDNAGMALIGTVHVGTNWVNAYWEGTQMVFGDGDGVDATYLSKSLDVVSHELTHGVTDRTANMTYSNESGALNEAMSDILGASTEAYADGAVSADTWKVGEDCWTPGTAGDALRYMNDPIADGQSYDYYPTRYTGTSDYGGVHLNSGIANLAYYLLCQGGTHPRGKTTVVVPAITMAKAEQIFYRALVTYMTTSTNFQAARTATAQAATDLYTATEVDAVQKCWDAVGAPGGVVTVTTLTNNVPVTGLGAATGNMLAYKIAVPSGQTSLVVSTSGGTGDADLYVKRGAMPTTSVYDGRGYTSGNAETVTISSPVAGDFYIGVQAYSTFASVTLKAVYSGAATPDMTVAISPTTLSVAQGASGTATVTTAVSGGFSSAVTLAVSGTPTGATATLSATSIAAPGSGTSTLTVGGGTATAGTYTLTITATGGGKTKTCTLSLTITAGSTVTVLTNNVPVTGVGAATGVMLAYKITVPASQTSLVVTTTGGTGDCDLYVKRGAMPTTSTYDVRGYTSGNAETCTITNPVAGDFFIGVYGYSTFSGATLKAVYAGSTPSMAVAISPTTLSVAQAATGTATVTTTVSGGFSNAVTLSVSGTPTGATATLSATSIAAPGSGTSTLTVGGGTATAGTYTLTITAVGGGLTKTCTLALTITASGGTMTETEANNAYTTANTIATSGTTVTGKIGTSTDVDFFKVTVGASKVLTVDLTVPAGKDYDVRILSSNGSTVLVTGQNGAGVAEHITYTNGSASAVYYIKVYGYNSAYSTTLNYTLKATF